MTNFQNSNNIQGSTMLNNQIFSVYEPVVKTMTFRLRGDKDLAHDITMDAIEKAIRKQDKYDSERANLVTWVSKIANRTLLDYYRSHVVSKTTSGYDNGTLELMAGGYDVDYGDVSVDAVDFWGTIETLTNVKEYGCLVRRFRDDMSYTDIAEDMGIPKGSVMSALSNGKSKLRESAMFKGLFE
tara:strand:- start:2171 stop:2722 length:552 start_codon:yes stop_codon:yes gene_type:complete